MRKTIQLFIMVLFLSAGCGSDHSETSDSMIEKSNSSPFAKQLAPCLDKPNCVVSEGADGRAAIEPIAFSAPPERAWSLLHQFLIESNGTIESETDYYLHATFRSGVFRFVDDVDCRLDVENRLIHIRSAARTGYYDFGVNRARVEKIRRFFIEHKM